MFFPDWTQFNVATNGLILLRQAPTNTPVFTKPSPLGKRHTIVKFPWSVNYWVIYKETHVKMSPTDVKSVVPSLNVGNTNSKFDITSHWLPTSATLTITDPNQPEPLIK